MKLRPAAKATLKAKQEVMEEKMRRMNRQTKIREDCVGTQFAPGASGDRQGQIVHNAAPILPESLSYLPSGLERSLVPIICPQGSGGLGQTSWS